MVQPVPARIAFTTGHLRGECDFISHSKAFYVTSYFCHDSSNFMPLDDGITGIGMFSMEDMDI
jgi:hypothetical protein